jgi:hypothetical protein
MSNVKKHIGFAWKRAGDADLLSTVLGWIWTVLGWLGWTAPILAFSSAVSAALLAHVKREPPAVVFIYFFCVFVMTFGLWILVRETFWPSNEKTVPKSINQQLAVEPHLRHFMGLKNSRKNPRAVTQLPWYSLTEALKHFPDEGLRKALVLYVERAGKARTAAEILGRNLGPQLHDHLAFETPAIARMREELQYKIDEHENCRRQIESINALMVLQLAESLKTGSLRARGFQGDKLIQIPKEQWDFLRFDQKVDGANGRGVSYHTVRIQDADKEAKQG